MRKTLQNLILLFFLCTYTSWGQTAPAPPPPHGISPQIQWQRTIGGNGGDGISCVQNTNDGGYIVGGTSGSGISGEKTGAALGGGDYWVVKLSPCGTIQWQKTIGGNDGDVLKFVQQTSDGGYIIGGSSKSGVSGEKTGGSRGDFDYWILKLDANGNILWQKTIGGNDADFLYSAKQTSDGGYILGGHSRSGASGEKTETSRGNFDYWVLKLDAIGNIQWQKTIGGNDADLLESIDQTSDGGYILGGESRSNISGEKTALSRGGYDYWVVKLYPNGGIQWQKTIGGSEQDVNLYAIQQTSDGGYILGGSSASNISGEKSEASRGDFDYWILKLNSIGAIQWQKTMGGSRQDMFTTIKQTNDGGYILGGHSWSGISGGKAEDSRGYTDCWIIKMGTIGDIQWQKTIGSNDVEMDSFIQQTPDGGYILIASSSSNISGEKTENTRGVEDYWVLKLGYGPLLSNVNATASSNSPVCESVSLNLTSSGGTSYSWVGPGGFTSTLQNPVRTPATTAMTGVYTVTVKNAAGCTATATIAVVVKPTPTVLGQSFEPICAGSSIRLNLGTSPAGGTINWYNAATGGTLLATGTLTVSPMTTTTYYASATLNGCEGKRVPIIVTVKQCCADVKYAVTCSRGVYTITFSFNNLSGQIIDRVRPVITTPGITASVPFINMSPLVQTGVNSGNYSFTISGATAGQKLCMSLILQKECDFKCQTPEFCIEVPPCIEPVACNLKYGINCQDPTGLRIKWQASNADGSVNTNVASISFNFDQANFFNSPSLNTFIGYGGDACIILDPAVKLPSKICGTVSMFDARGNLLCKQEYCFELPICKICQFEAGIEGVTGDVKWEVTNHPERTNLNVYACSLKEFTMFVYGSYSDIVPVLPLPAGILYVTPSVSSQSVLVGLNYNLITVPTVFKLLVVSKEDKCCAKVLTITVLPCPKNARIGLNEPTTTEDANSYITVYPNPVENDEVTVFLNKKALNFEKGIPQLELYNMQGQLLKQQLFKVGFDEAKISMQELPTGVYIISLRQNGQSLSTVKIIKH